MPSTCHLFQLLTTFSDAFTMRVVTLSALRQLPRRQSRLVFRTYATAFRLTSPTSQDVAHFAGFLPASSIITSLDGSTSSKKAETAELEQYNADWMGKYMGKSQVVLRPKTTEDVSKIMKHCWERRIGVVPQGGNTGLVGEYV